MYGNKTTDLENNFTTDLENDILLLTLKIFLILILRVIFLWELYFSTDLHGHISITDLESDFFTNTFFYHWPWEWYFTTTFFYYWPWEWYFWGGCLPEQPVACDWSPGKGQGSLHCLSDGNCTEIPWCCASLTTPSTNRYNVNNHNGLFLLYVF